VTRYRLLRGALRGGGRVAPWLLSLAAGLVYLVPCLQAAEPIVQTTEGSCSPVVGNVKGEVVINIVCPGVDPAALERFNEMVRLAHRKLGPKLDGEEPLKLANRWSAIYVEIKRQTTKASCSPAVGNVEGKVTLNIACSFIDPNSQKRLNKLISAGDFAAAGRVLDLILKQVKQNTDFVADHHFVRAQLYDLDLDWERSLQHYRQAYLYRPDSFPYGRAYAMALERHGSVDEAESVFLDLVKLLQKAPDAKSVLWLYSNATTYDQLCNLYLDLERYEKMEDACGRALDFYTQSLEKDPAQSQRLRAAMLNNLGLAYAKTDRPTLAESILKTALDLHRQSKSMPEVAETQVNLAYVYQMQDKTLPQAEELLRDAVLTLQPLASTNPQYAGEFAMSTFDLAQVYLRLKDLKNAETILYAASLTLRRLGSTNPSAIQALLGRTLISLGRIYEDTGRTDEAKAAYEEACKKYGQLSSRESTEYAETFALGFDRLGEIYLAQGKLSDALRVTRAGLEAYRRSAHLAFQEAKMLHRLAQIRADDGGNDEEARDYGEAALRLYNGMPAADRQQHKDMIANLLLTLAEIYRSIASHTTGDASAGCAYIQQALDMTTDEDLRSIALRDGKRCPAKN
jgi:tetratricopeptide (TPR) repeat protein